jgi:hypothetical protein
MREHILSEIQRRRDELAGLEQRRLILTAQLSVLEELLPHALDANVTQRRAPRTQAGVVDAPADAVGGKARLSARWMPVLVEAVRRHPRTVHGEDVPDIQRAAGQEPADANNTRSHFWANCKPGKFYERVGPNEYRATEVGAELVGMPLGGRQDEVQDTDGADEAAPSDEIEGRDEPTDYQPNGLDLLNHNRAWTAGGGT